VTVLRVNKDKISGMKELVGLGPKNTVVELMLCGLNSLKEN